MNLIIEMFPKQLEIDKEIPSKDAECWAYIGKARTECLKDWYRTPRAYYREVIFLFLSRVLNNELKTRKSSKRKTEKVNPRSSPRTRCRGWQKRTWQLPCHGLQFPTLTASCHPATPAEHDITRGLATHTAFLRKGNQTLPLGLCRCTGGGVGGGGQRLYGVR